MKRVRSLSAVVVAGFCLTACAPSVPAAVPSQVPGGASPAISSTTTVIPSPVEASTTPPVEATTPAVTTPAVTTPTTSAPTVATSAPPASMPADLVFPTADVHAWMKTPSAAPGKLVFLTFDDGPNTSITPKVLDALKAAQVHATFFVVGQEVPHAPEVLKREVAEGNRIALHSMTHDYKKLYPGRSAKASRVASEFDGTLAAVRDVLGPDFTTTAWRYPGGHMSWKNMAASDAALEARGATWMDWNAMTGDAEPKKRRPTTQSAMVAMATQPIAEGMRVVVVLAHDSGGKNLTVASLPQIIDAYKAAGYTFGTMS